MTIENRAWRRSHEVREAIAAKQEITTLTMSDGEVRVLKEGERVPATRHGRGRSGGPRAANTYRAARIPSGAVKVRGVYPHKIDHKTWRALYRSKKWSGNGEREMTRRVAQMWAIGERMMREYEL